MFDFFKRGKKTDKDEEDQIKAGSGYAAADSVRSSTAQANREFAKPQDYTGNRMLYDDGKAKRAAKTKLFESGQEIRDPYTGEKLVLTKKEAKFLYGDDWQKHLAESDHTIPLERIHEQYKQNVWVKNADIKDAANSNENLEVTSRKYNNPKRSSMPEEFAKNDELLKKTGLELTDEAKERMIQHGEAAQNAVDSQLRTSAVRNVFETGNTAGMQAAASSGVTAVTMDGIMNMVAVIKGEKDAKDAISDTIKTGGKAAVTGYVTGSTLTVASHTLSNFSNDFVQKLISSGAPGKVVTAVMVTGNTLEKYANGEITTQECLIELGDKGLNLATTGYSMAVGQALIPIPIVGAAIGALVGTTASSQLYRGLIGDLQTKQIEHQERQRIIEECREASEQARAFRKELEEYLKAYFDEYRSCFEDALDEIGFGFQSGDAQSIVSGANKITRKLGGTACYDTLEEFRAHLSDGSIDVL